jgi:hypothetical protein
MSLICRAGRAYNILYILTIIMIICSELAGLSGLPIYWGVECHPVQPDQLLYSHDDSIISINEYIRVYIYYNVIHNNQNKEGPSIDPWGTSAFIISQSE